MWSRVGVPFRSLTEPTSLAPCDLCQNVVSSRIHLLPSHGVIVEFLFQKIIRTWAASVKSPKVHAVTSTARHLLNILGAHVCFKCALPTLGAHLPATKCTLTDPLQPVPQHPLGRYSHRPFRPKDLQGYAHVRILGHQPYYQQRSLSIYLWLLDSSVTTLTIPC